MTLPLLPPPPQLLHPKYRPDIDGLRALAVLSVVAFHAFPGLAAYGLSGGFIGVDVFFVISGFLISTIIFENLDKETFSFTEFYSRRITRIFPALLLVLIASYAFGWFALLADEYKQLGMHIAAGAGFFSNFALWNEAGYFDNSSETKPLLHLWSLGIEEQFYIVWPLLLWVAWKKKFNLLTITILVLAISFYLNVKGIKKDAVATFYSPQTRFWELLCGSVLAWVTLYKKDSFSTFRTKLDGYLASIVYREKPVVDGNALSNVISFLGMSLLMYGFWKITKEARFPGTKALFPVLGTVLIIAAGPAAWINRTILSNKIAVWFGLISFPLYLWHWPLLSFARIVESEVPSRNIRIAAVLISIVLAWLTYKLVERPIRLGGSSKTKVTSLVVLMSIAGYVGYHTYDKNGLLTRNVVNNNPSTEQSVLFEENPNSPCEKIVGLDDQWCSVFKGENANSAAKILLWGDSSVSAFLPVFKDISKKENFTLIAISHPSCPPILGAKKTSFPFPLSMSYCSTGLMQEEVINFISEEKPDLIILIAAWNSYSPFSNREFITNNSNTIADSNSTKETIKFNLPNTIDNISKISNVLIFKSWPFLISTPNYQVNRLPFWQASNNTGTSSTHFFNDDSSFVNDVLDHIKTPNVFFYNPSAKVCIVENCSLVLNGKKLYSDTYHITPQGSMELRVDILDAVNSALNR